MPYDSIPTEMDELEAFFGCPLQKVEHFILSIARVLDRPEWLRGIINRQQLPRHEKHLPYSPKRHLVKKASLLGVEPKERAERVVWIIDNLSGPWAYEVHGFWFLKPSDVMHYQLRFSGTD